MVSRLTGAIMRAFLVMVLIATPSALLPGVGSDGRQMVALVALFAGLLTLIEYNATYPGLVEFRDAPPFNRLRFLMLFATVFSLTIIQRGQTDPSALSELTAAVGTLIGLSMDFPYSPVRLATLMLSDGAPASHVANVRTAAGMSYLISLLSLSVFVIMMKVKGWPGRSGAFNVWINLPTFDPTAGGDVINRLERDARINVMLGFLLPFLMPAVVKMGGGEFTPMTMGSPQALIWVMVAWSFLPASLFMRGIAMLRIADMIREKRRMGLVAAGPGYMAA